MRFRRVRSAQAVWNKSSWLRSKNGQMYKFVLWFSWSSWILWQNMAKIFDFQGWIIKIVATFMSTLDGISALRRSELLELKESWLSADFHGLQIFLEGKSRTSMVFCGTHGENLRKQFFFLKCVDNRIGHLCYGQWAFYAKNKKSMEIGVLMEKSGKSMEHWIFSGTI